MFIFHFLDNILFYTQYPLSMEYTFIVRNSLAMKKKTLRNDLTFICPFGYFTVKIFMSNVGDSVT